MGSVDLSAEVNSRDGRQGMLHHLTNIAVT